MTRALLSDAQRSQLLAWSGDTLARLQEAPSRVGHCRWFEAHPDQTALAVWRRFGAWEYRVRLDPGDAYATLWRRTDQSDKAQCLVDPPQIVGEAQHRLAVYAVSDCGAYCAFALNRLGNDEETLFLSGPEGTAPRLVAPRLVASGLKYTRLAWDGAGAWLYFARYWAAEAGFTLDRTRPDGTPETVMDFRSRDGVIPFVTRPYEAGRVFIGACQGADFRNALWVEEEDRFVQVQQMGIARTQPLAVTETSIFLDTTMDAPKGRLVRAELSMPDRNWTEIMPERDLPLGEVVKSNKTLWAMHSNAITSAITAVDMETGDVLATAEGFAGEALSPIATHDGTDRLATICETLVEPPRLRHFDASTLGHDPEHAGQSRSDVLLARSADGTEIPVSIIGETVDPSRILLYTYGGFGVVTAPYYDTLARRWVEMGGLYAVAHVRGGGEFGDDWHQSATGLNKGRSFEDVIAAADHLHTAYPKAPLAIIGASNGGLHACGAMAMRPDLFDAGIAQVPVTDLLALHDLEGDTDLMGEYGDPRVPEQRAAMQTFSPLEQLRKNTRPYPPILMTTSLGDDRVSARHVYAFQERLCQIDPDAIPWVICDTDLGHWGGTSAVERGARAALFMTFLDQTLSCSGAKPLAAVE